MDWSIFRMTVRLLLVPWQISGLQAPHIWLLLLSTSDIEDGAWRTLGEIFGSFSNTPTGIYLKSEPRAKRMCTQFELEIDAVRLVVGNCHSFHGAIEKVCLKMVMGRSVSPSTKAGPFCGNTQIIHLWNCALFIAVFPCKIIFPWRKFHT